jgi:pimeloyl-ACP methyl ester carboxylesterase
MTKEYSIEVENKEELAAVHHEVNSDKWIFFCHGFGSNKEGSYKRRCERMVKEGWNAVRFDFRGNGESDGSFIDQNLSKKIEDLKAVIEYFEPERYCLFGSSFGGKVAFHSTEELTPEAVIGRAPVTYNDIMEKYKAVVENKGEFTHHKGATIDQSFFDDFDSYSFGRLADRIDVPVAIFHGREDTTVHPEKSVKAAEEFDQSVMLQLIEGEDHFFSDETEEYMLSQMVSWLHSNGF